METKKKRAVFFSGLFFLCACIYDQTSLSPDTTEDAVGGFELLQNRSGGITVTGYRGTEKNVVIPETIGGLPVTIIGNKAFYRRDISAVTIPETVLIIEPLAFAENQLQSAVIAGCTSIGYEAFAGNQLSDVVFSERLSSIGPRAFINNKLSSITLPGKITNIGKDAFTGNTLTSITVGLNRNLFTGQGFELSFVNYYVGMGRKAGVYVKDGQVWLLRE
ncbi:MAG: leucine-rich repeat domain-containing protein [Treponema sp.]|jgi:hypothetical protein|nr:leucine-rich repeat domain-containing protein [Treponema sp.]